ncbi:MAG: ABC transporter permease [Gemmatimonadota bacterium]|nr:ABC transporter permease [Gemmatimonadota bacterium]
MSELPSGAGFERYIARRYLRGARGRGLVSFVTLIAVGGVAVGVMALIVVIGVLNGLQNNLRDRILSGGPHAIALELNNNFRMDGWREALAEIRADEEVVAAAPFAYTHVLLNAGDSYNHQAVLRGIVDDESASQVSGLVDHLVVGNTPFVPSESGEPGIVVGRGLARQLGLFIGKQITVISVQNTPLTSLGLSPSLRRFEVVGIFQTGLYQFDDELAMVALPEAQALLGLGDAVTGIEFDVEDPWRSAEVSARLEESLGYPYRIDDWQRLNASLFSALKLEKLAMAVILTLIVLVASFNIVSTLVMIVGDKTREIGILRGMGVTAEGIARVFRSMGLFIGIVGTTLGGILGGILAWALQRFEFIDLPNDIYFLDKLPIALDPLDVTLILGGSILISFISTIYPARKAADLTPVEAIRHE